MLNRTFVLVSPSANCTPQDETFLISNKINIKDYEKVTYGVKPKYHWKKIMKASKISKSSRKIKKRPQQIPKITSFPIKDYLNKNFQCQNYSSYEHNYFSKTPQNKWVASEYATETIKHTAGAVYHTIKPKIKCKSCLNIIDGKNSKNKSILTTIKNWGGLKFASDEVNYICYCVEKVIRSQDNLLQGDKFLKVLRETLQILPNDILDDGAHVFEQEPLYDHRHHLILLIIQEYIDKRFHHEDMNMKDTIDRLRMHNNKMTIFSESNN